MRKEIILRIKSLRRIILRIKNSSKNVNMAYNNDFSFAKYREYGGRPRTETPHRMDPAQNGPKMTIGTMSGRTLKKMSLIRMLPITLSLSTINKKRMPTP